jgi:hypothetical protein
MPHSLRQIFRNACTVPLGRQSLEIITTEKGGIVEGIFMKRGPHFSCRLIFSNPFTLLSTMHSTCLTSSLCATGTVFQRKLTKEEVVPKWRQQKARASTYYFFFLGGRGCLMFRGRSLVHLEHAGCVHLKGPWCRLHDSIKGEYYWEIIYKGNLGIDSHHVCS